MGVGLEGEAGRAGGGRGIFDWYVKINLKSLNLKKETQTWAQSKPSHYSELQFPCM